MAAGAAHDDHEWSAVALFGADRSSPSIDLEHRFLDIQRLRPGCHGWLLLRDAAPALAVTSDGRLHRWGKSRPWGANVWAALSLSVSLLEW